MASTRHRSPAPPPGWLSPALATARTLTLATCLPQLDLTAVALVLPAIAAAFDLDVGTAAWITEAYSVAFMGTLLIAGALADRYGRRRMLLAGNMAFAVTSLGCGLAGGAATLCAARAFQGASAAFVITGALASLSFAYPLPAERARAFGLLGVTTGAAMVLGPSLGGLLAAALGWRAVFLVNLPICLAVACAVPSKVAETFDPEGRPLDIPGVALLSGGLLACVLALLDGSASVPTRAMLVTGALGLGLVFVRRQRGQARPMLDPALVTRREPLGIACALVALSIGYWSVLVYLPLALKAVYGLATDEIGLAMLALTLPMLVLPPQGARLAVRWGWPRLFGFGLLVLAAGTAALALTLHWDRPLAETVVAMLVAASGAGLINAQVSGALIASAPAARAGMASSFSSTLRQGGFALGIALLGAVAGAGPEGEAFAPAFAVAASAAFFGAIAVIRVPRRNPDHSG
ncbi:MFS transporter [Methylobacterium sp. D54C]